MLKMLKLIVPWHRGFQEGACIYQSINFLGLFKAPEHQQLPAGWPKRGCFESFRNVLNFLCLFMVN